MDESTKSNPCAFCPRCCKAFFGIFLIVLGVNLLKSEMIK